MPGCVLDASAVTAMILPSQGTAAALAFAKSPPTGFLAPSLFRLEVRNAVVRLERRKLVPLASIDANLARLEVAITFAPFPTDADLLAIVDLGRAEQLSLFDASYLNLALRNAAALASRDEVLLAAAKRRGVHVYDLS